MPQLDLLALGNAIVDVIAHTEDDFLVSRKMQKGSMNLIDEATALSIGNTKHLFAGRRRPLADAGTCMQRSLPRTDRR